MDVGPQHGGARQAGGAFGGPADHLRVVVDAQDAAAGEGGAGEGGAGEGGAGEGGAGGAGAAALPALARCAPLHASLRALRTLRTGRLRRRLAGAELPRHIGLIMADAAHAVLTAPAAGTTGRCHIDEEVLRAAGVTGFDVYRADPASTEPLRRDIFL
ncbi:hypothetical protein Kpho01_25030 [Kitasatospora phosalacinea]|uniref:Uncharacterized protein n=2 Tax=Kitasatospora phosalacinea TaxID=2065 RepID=A0A9W6UNT9_9ACTN|nr:hypothetical protein Kpho01_25030 [Kitasatospora phosalacinea]